MLNTEQWSEKFHAAGLRIEFARAMARIVVQQQQRERWEQIATAKRVGVAMNQIAAVFEISREGARQVIKMATCQGDEAG